MKNKIYAVFGGILFAVIWFCNAAPAGGAGTFNVPASYPTIQAGIDAAQSAGGGTVLVADGTYAGTLNMTAGGSVNDFLIIQAKNKWGASISGQNSHSYGIIGSANADYVRIVGLDIRDFRQFGIIFNQGGNDYVEIIDCKIHDIGGTGWSSYASGILFGGNNSTTANTNTLIDSNVFYANGREPLWSYCNANCCQHDHHIYFVNQDYCTVKNNIFFDNKVGMALNLGSGRSFTDFKLINNTFVSEGVVDALCGWGGAANHFISENPIYGLLMQNNIFYVVGGDAAFSTPIYLT